MTQSSQRHNLQNKRIAILATNGFEQSELLEPRKALQAAGARVDVISPESGKIKAWNEKNWGQEVPVDVTLDRANASDYDALVLPGGVINADHLRLDQHAVDFARSFFDAGKPIGAICHAPWLLINANIAGGKTLTSYPSLEADLRNAGANWVDREVVVDNGLVTSRNVPDIPAFSRKLIEEIAEGMHERITAGN